MSNIMVHPRTKCWVYGGASYKRPYGTFKLDGKLLRTNRASWQLHNGPIPDGMHVCHHCDRPSCVNPDHLFLGTAQENKADSVSKDRHMRGERAPFAKLTTADVIKIRADTRSLEEISKDYGVSYKAIDHVKRRKNWKHVA